LILLKIYSLSILAQKLLIFFAQQAKEVTNRVKKSKRFGRLFFLSSINLIRGKRGRVSPKLVKGERKVIQKIERRID